MDVRLRVLSGTNAGQEIAVSGPRFFIGRSEDCNLRPRSDLISRHHCAMLVEESSVVLRDFGSKNGTFVNDERVTGERDLATGDRVKVGPIEFEILINPSTPGSPAKKRPKVTSTKEAAARTAESTQVDLDVTQWLGPAETEGEADTRILDSVETTEVPGRTKEKQPAAEETRKEAVSSGKKGSADSGKAAAEVLKKFFNRR
jgi:pSer/pThr/pTyr-binding forkhead associated (FHA) protein